MTDFIPASEATAKSRKAKKVSVSKHKHAQKMTSKKEENKKEKDMIAAMEAEFKREEFAPSSSRNLVDTQVTQEQADEAMVDTDDDDDDAVMLVDHETAPAAAAPMTSGAGEAAETGLDFAPIKNHNVTTKFTQRKVSIPPHRMTPLKRDWIQIYTPLVEECGLQVRMNVHRRTVELRTTKYTAATAIGESSISRASDFLHAYGLGFAVQDAIALLRLEDLYIESFEIKDVKTLHGEHLSRAIGRIAGHEGRTRFVIENASRTRIVLADTKIHILGTFANIRIARDAICALILGSPPGKIYANLRTVASRARQRY